MLGGQNVRCGERERFKKEDREEERLKEESGRREEDSLRCHRGNHRHEFLSCEGKKKKKTSWVSWVATPITTSKGERRVTKRGKMRRK